MKMEEIQQQCEALSNEELFLVVNNKRLYNEKIVRAAYQEINRRGLSKQEAKEIEKVLDRQSKIVTGNIHEDILFLEKFGFYFLCFFRLNRLVTRDYRKKGFVLKVRQATYYTLLGLVFLFSAIGIGQFFHTFLIGAVIWVAGFLLTYLFNRFYFKETTIRRLEARTAKSETD